MTQEKYYHPDYIMHYGVLGMKWGRRKARYSTNHKKNAKSLSKLSNKAKTSEQKQWKKYGKIQDKYISKNKKIPKRVSKKYNKGVDKALINKKKLKDKLSSISTNELESISKETAQKLADYYDPESKLFKTTRRKGKLINAAKSVGLAAVTGASTGYAYIRINTDGGNDYLQKKINQGETLAFAVMDELTKRSDSNLYGKQKELKKKLQEAGY